MIVLYFGIYKPDFSRNKIYMRGLRASGVTVLECRDDSRGLLKYWRLWRKHRALHGGYDALVVGYPGHLVVPFAKLLSKKPVIADLLGSLSDAEMYSHNPHFLRRILSRFIDWLAVNSADAVLVESEAQRKFFIERFGPSKKYTVLYTGVDETVFHCETPSVRKDFLVLFRGRLTPESGILSILETASLLKGRGDIHFRIVGSGPLLSRAESVIREKKLSHVELISEYLSEEKLRDIMCEASLSLGQFEDNPRLSRTIPHKAFESFAMGIPYLSGDAPGIREVGAEGETCFFSPLANPEKLAEKIETLSRDKELLKHVGDTAHREFEENFSSSVLGEKLREIISAYKEGVLK